MGLKDAATKNFFGRPDVLASLLDYVLYGGQHTVQRSQLRELSGEHCKINQVEVGKFKTDNRFRDKLFEFDTGSGLLSIGLELQSRNDNSMVLRIMHYDLRRFDTMLSGGQRSRIINIVLSFDRKHRSSASCLREMFGEAPHIAEKYTYDYGFIGLNIYDLAEKSELFSCKELKEILNYFKNDQDRVELVKSITEGMLKGHLSRDAALVCATFMDLKIDIDNEAEEIDMCKAIRDFKRECIKEGKKLGIDEGKKLGIDEGKKLGIAIGEENAVRAFIKTLLSKSFSLLEICSLTGASEEMVREIALTTQQ
ncbi:MAG: Rpn family recombination-promoting nuclease/putative transposase [Victivallales bacterium]|nr:Rpn family recombination-promoting nuclease/putative transposase [Victivallales bacterium]